MLRDWNVCTYSKATDSPLHLNGGQSVVGLDTAVVLSDGRLHELHCLVNVLGYHQSGQPGHMQ